MITLKKKIKLRVDPDSNLFKDLQTFKTKDGKDHILLNILFKVIHLISIIFIRFNWL